MDLFMEMNHGCGEAVIRAVSRNVPGRSAMWWYLGVGRILRAVRS
jgi:hypothetical protein